MQDLEWDIARKAGVSTNALRYIGIDDDSRYFQRNAVAALRILSNAAAVPKNFLQQHYRSKPQYLLIRDQ